MVVPWPSIDVVKKHMTSEWIVAAAKALPTHAASTVAGDSTPVNVDALTKDDVVVDFSLMHYGMKERNPLDFIKFYSKRNPNRKFLRQLSILSITLVLGGASAGPGDYSNLMPQFHAELLMRIYTKKVEYYGLIQAGYRVCLVKINDLLNSGMSPTLTSSPGPRHGRREEESMAPTPPATGAPTTPHVRASPSFNLGVVGTPLIPNDFMTVPKDYAPKSPSRTWGGGGGRDTSPSRGRDTSPSPGPSGRGSGNLRAARVGVVVGPGSSASAGPSTNPMGVRVEAGTKRGREGSVGRVDSGGQRNVGRSRERERGGGSGRKRRRVGGGGKEVT
jgi:hypothetical protein